MDFNTWYDKIYKYPYIFTSKNFAPILYGIQEYDVNRNDYGFYIPPNINFQTIPIDSFLYKTQNSQSNLVDIEKLYAPFYNVNFSNNIKQYRLEGCNINITSDYIQTANPNILLGNQNDGTSFLKNTDGYRITVEKHKINNSQNTKPWQTRTNDFAIHKEIGYKHNDYLDLYTGSGFKAGNLDITNNKLIINKDEGIAVVFTPLSGGDYMKTDFAEILKIKNIQIQLMLKAL